MNQEARIEKIKIAKQSEPIGLQEILWKGQLEKFNVYKIPLDALIYNKYNGRILSRTKSLEKRGQIIDASSTEGKEIVADLLYKSHPQRNKRTLEDLQKHGQLKIGIITEDGVIIDGNRRAMLLNQLGEKYFKAIVLDCTLEKDSLAIQKLETSYQMGEDEKLSYNPIEKYLKTKDLYDSSISVEEIAEWMGETVSNIKEQLEIVKMMEEYLDYFEYEGIYTQLDGREDPFIFLNKWMKNLETCESRKGFDGYDFNDVSALKQIAFHYIRAKFHGKEFRKLAEGNRENHFFGDRDIWERFSSTHFEKILPILEEERRDNPIDYKSNNLNAHLNERDESYRKKVADLLEEMHKEYDNKLYYRQAGDKPSKNIASARSAIESIDKGHRKTSERDFIDDLGKLYSEVSQLYLEKSPIELMEEILKILEKIDSQVGNSTLTSSEMKEELFDKIKSINKLTFQIEKKM